MERLNLGVWGPPPPLGPLEPERVTGWNLTSQNGVAGTLTSARARNQRSEAGISGSSQTALLTCSSSEKRCLHVSVFVKFVG